MKKVRREKTEERKARSAALHRARKAMEEFHTLRARAQALGPYDPQNPFMVAMADKAVAAKRRMERLAQKVASL